MPVFVDRISSAVLRGVSHEGRFVGGDARNQEPDGDTRRRDSDLDRFGPSDRRNTLCPGSLVYCIEYMMSSRGPLPLLIYSRGAGLQVKYHIWYYTMSCGARRVAPCTSFLWAGPPLMVRPISCLEDRGAYPHSTSRAKLIFSTSSIG